MTKRQAQRLAKAKREHKKLAALADRLETQAFGFEQRAKANREKVYKVETKVEELEEIIAFLETK
jgi:hypothetical protein